MAGNKIAVYLRLSQEDVDLKHNALKDESIAGCLIVIQNYI